MEKLEPGERILLTFDDDPTYQVSATVCGFLSDQEEGLGPEIQDYVACWVEVDVRNETGTTTRQSLTFGTDYRYDLGGRKVTLRKAV